MKEKDHSLRGKIGEYTIIQTKSGDSVYVFDDASGTVLMHASLSAPFPTVEGLQEAFAESVKKAAAGKKKEPLTKVTVTQESGQEIEKTFDGALLAFRWAYMKMQTESVASVTLERIDK